MNEEIIMRIETLVAAMLVLSPIATAAQTEPRAGAAAPHFSTVENRTIGRNELLRSIVSQDPWLVRQILDLIAVRNARGRGGAAAPALDGIDLSANPDIAPAARTAAGSVELIDLLRRARDEKQAARKGARMDSTERSAAGTVETIEMLRRAQEAKGTRK
jgi:hypothetical protein